MCSCKTGYRLDNATMRCLYVDECVDKEDLCWPGSCQNTAGGFQCSCPTDYMLSSDGTECIDMRREPCHMSHSRDQCLDPMTRPQTRLVCCCSMGAGWGLQCKACPDKVAPLADRVNIFFLSGQCGAQSPLWRRRPWPDARPRNWQS